MPSQKVLSDNAARRDAVAREVIDREREQREAKTARLKALRLARLGESAPIQVKNEDDDIWGIGPKSAQRFSDKSDAQNKKR
jgi:hypothetical protein